MDHGSAILFISSRSPRSSSAPLACLEAAMTTAVFGLPVHLLLLGEGVLQLQQGHTQALGDRSLARMFGALGLYGIETLYLDGAALRRYGLNAGALLSPADCESPLRLEILQDPGSLAILLAQSNVVFNF